MVIRVIIVTVYSQYYLRATYNFKLTFYLDQEAKFQKSMKFLTGTFTMPSPGMPRKIKISFKRDCSLE